METTSRTDPGSTSENSYRPTGRVALVQSCWHREIVDCCRDAFVAEMGKLGYPSEGIDVFEVPGAFEIPLQAKVLALSGRYVAVAATGLVVDGGIYRHDFVASAVIDALMQVQLETTVPVLSAVLTPHHFHEHPVHHDFFHQHFSIKGVELAAATSATIANLARIRQG
jgi:6,7-dimethyl-8-ribityllumazine synthase